MLYRCYIVLYFVIFDADFSTFFDFFCVDALRDVRPQFFLSGPQAPPRAVGLRGVGRDRRVCAQNPLGVFFLAEALRAHMPCTSSRGVATKRSPSPAPSPNFRFSQKRPKANPMPSRNPNRNPNPSPMQPQDPPAALYPLRVHANSAKKIVLTVLSRLLSDWKIGLPHRVSCVLTSCFRLHAAFPQSSCMRLPRNRRSPLHVSQRCA